MKLRRKPPLQTEIIQEQPLQIEMVQKRPPKVPTFVEFKYKFEIATIYDIVPYICFCQILMAFIWLPFSGKNPDLVTNLVQISILWLAVVFMVLIGNIILDFSKIKTHLRIYCNKTLPLLAFIGIYNTPVNLLSMEANLFSMGPNDSLILTMLYQIIVSYLGFLLLKLKKYIQTYDLNKQIELFGVGLTLITILITFLQSSK